MKMKFDEVLEIDINLTGYCNLKCPLCDTNVKSFKDFRKRKNILPLKEWIKILNQFPNIRQINFIGKSSEPTLYPEFIEFCKYLKTRNIIIIIRSNGDTNNTDFWNNLGSILSNPDKIYFAIDGSNQIIHETYRIGSNLNRILDNHKHFKISNKSNNCDYIQTIEFQFNTIDIHTDEFKKIQSLFSGNEYIISCDYPEYIKNRDWIKKVPDQITALKQHWSILKKIDKGPITKINCKALSNKSIYIDFDGKIFPCCGVQRENIATNFEKNSVLDFSSFINKEIPDCKICDINLEKFAEKFNLRNRHND